MASVSQLLGNKKVRTAKDVDQLLLDTINKVNDGSLSKTQAYSIGYLANILYRRAKDMERPGIHRGVDQDVWSRKIAKLEKTLSVNRSRSRRPTEVEAMYMGQAE